MLRAGFRISRGIVFGIILLVVIVSKKVYAGGDAEHIVYHVGDGSDNGMTLPEFASAGINAVSHVPYEKEFIEAANKLGIKILPYVSPTCKIITPKYDPLLLRHPYLRELNADQHPEWFLITEDGKIGRYSEGYKAGIEIACLNHQSLIEANVRGITNLMELGCGGIFVDNAYGRPFCYGEKLGIHKHDWPEKTNAQLAYTMMKKVYETVQKYGKDKLCFLNAETTPTWKGMANGVMMESFIHSSEVKGELGDRKSNRSRPYWEDFKREYANYQINQQYMPLIAQTYLEDPCTDDESAFFSFTCAKLLGVQMWNGYNYRGFDAWSNHLGRRDIVRVLYREHNLGKALSKPVISDNYGYRLFERGIVVINPTEKALTLDIPSAYLGSSLAELYSGRELKVQDGKVNIVLPPAETGRVILTKEEVLRNYLEEVKGELVASRLYIEDNVRKFQSPKFDKEIIPELLRLEKKVDKFLGDRGRINHKEIYKFSLEVSQLKEDKVIIPTATVLRNEYKDLNKEKIEKLLELPGSILSDIEIYDGGERKAVLVRSSGTTYILPAYPGGRLTNVPFYPDGVIQYGDDGFFNLVTGPISSVGSSGDEFVKHRSRKYARFLIKSFPEMKVEDTWVTPLNFQRVEVVVNTPDYKKVEGLMNLCGGNSKKEVEDIYMKLSAEVRKGSPFLHLDCFLVNKDGKGKGELFTLVLLY